MRDATAALWTLTVNCSSAVMTASHTLTGYGVRPHKRKGLTQFVLPLAYPALFCQRLLLEGLCPARAQFSRDDSTAHRGNPKQNKLATRYPLLLHGTKSLSLYICQEPRLYRAAAVLVGACNAPRGDTSGHLRRTYPRLEVLKNYCPSPRS